MLSRGVHKWTAASDEGCSAQEEEEKAGTKGQKQKPEISRSDCIYRVEGSDFRLTVDGYNGNAGDTLRWANDELCKDNYV